MKLREEKNPNFINTCFHYALNEVYTNAYVYMYIKREKKNLAQYIFIAYIT